MNRSTSQFVFRLFIFYFSTLVSDVVVLFKRLILWKFWLECDFFIQIYSFIFRINKYKLCVCVHSYTCMYMLLFFLFSFFLFELNVWDLMKIQLCFYFFFIFPLSFSSSWMCYKYILRLCVYVCSSVCECMKFGSLFMCVCVCVVSFFFSFISSNV